MTCQRGRVLEIKHRRSGEAPRWSLGPKAPAGRAPERRSPREVGGQDLRAQGARAQTQTSLSPGAFTSALAPGPGALACTSRSGGGGLGALRGLLTPVWGVPHAA